MTRRIDVKQAYRLRQQGFTWNQISKILPGNFQPNSIQGAVSEWLKSKHRKR